MTLLKCIFCSFIYYVKWATQVSAMPPLFMTVLNILLSLLSSCYLMLNNFVNKHIDLGPLSLDIFFYLWPIMFVLLFLLLLFAISGQRTEKSTLRYAGSSYSYSAVWKCTSQRCWNLSAYWDPCSFTEKVITNIDCMTVHVLNYLYYSAESNNRYVIFIMTTARFCSVCCGFEFCYTNNHYLYF